MDTELLADMATFASVVDHNSFSGAADALNMSKSSVSRRVASLEQRLETKLMQRTTRTLSLTESGRLYYEYCARLVNDAKEADTAVQMMRSVPSGTLNLSLPETLGRVCILPILPEFLRQYPDIRLNLTITSRKVDLAEERMDVAVRKGVIEDNSLMAVPLGSSTQFLYATQDYVAGAAKLDSPSDLTAHPFLSSQVTVGPMSVTLWRDLEETEIKVEPRLAVKDHDALLSMTLEGLGVALLPVWMAQPHVNSGRLQQLLPDYRGPSIDFNIVFQPHRGLTPSVRAFIQFLTHKFADKQPWMPG